MSNTISDVTQTQAAQTQAVAPPPKATDKAQQLPADTVKISSAAQLAAEAVESRATTIQEAAKGDNQARRLLAKEDAAAQQVGKK
jgi:hypothetical protein